MRFVAMITCEGAPRVCMCKVSHGTTAAAARSTLHACMRAACLHVAARVEAVHLVEQLKHGALDLALATRRAVVALCADRVNLVCAPHGAARRTRHGA
jgi:hypothetical protein